MKAVAIITTLILMGLSFATHAEELDATSIITKVYETKRVEDQISTLTFTFFNPDKAEQRVVYTMVWKNMHGEDKFDNKAMFFTEFPPEKKGIAYLGWLRVMGSDAKDDEWIYLPELRMVRRIAHRDPNSSHDVDEFGNSILMREHLDPRPPDLDRHELMDEQELDGRMHYVIASTPEQQNANQISKIIYWIDKQNFRTSRKQFFDQDNQLSLDMNISWTQLGDYWVWQKVTAIDPRNQAKTVLEIGDIKINSNLNDRLFSKKSLDKDPQRLH